MAQAEVLFRASNYDPDRFTKDGLIAGYAAVIDSLYNERLEEPLKTFKINGKVFSSKKRSYEMPLKFLVELANLDLDHETFRHYHLCAALIYREDWDKPFSIDEYHSNAELFYNSLAVYSVSAVQLYNELLVTLRNSYPILFQGESSEKSKGRRLYDLVYAFSDGKGYIMKEAEETEIYRCYLWAEQKKLIEQKLK